MLSMEKSKNNGGFILWGDYWTLREMHSLCMDASNKSPTLDSRGLLPALAYDLRKAYEKQRQVDTVNHFEEVITVYGVEHVWPTFIVQLALLRSSLAFYDSSKLEQSIVYRLEHLFESILPDVFPKSSGDVLEGYMSLLGFQEDQVKNVLGSRVSYFLSLTKAKRVRELPTILRSINSVTDSFLRNNPSHREHLFDPTVFEGHSWDTLPDRVTL